MPMQSLRFNQFPAHSPKKPRRKAGREGRRRKQGGKRGRKETAKVKVMLFSDSFL